MESREDVIKQLQSPCQNMDSDSAMEILANLKSKAVQCDDQFNAKELWKLESIVKIHRDYWGQFEDLKAGRFYQAWCKLEQVELGLMRLRPHAEEFWVENQFHVPFVEKTVLDLQSIFPYRLFMSPEILCEEKLCSICEAPVSIRKPCGHKVGEIYNGEHCGRVITKSKFIGLSLVDDPVQKYSVPFMSDPEGNTVDQYNYSLVKYVAERWPSPFHGWSVTKTTALHPKSKFGKVGRNHQCPCESGDKYKKCCMHREGIVRPHYDFEFHYEIPRHMQTTEFST